jgi:hypothetical protein
MAFVGEMEALAEVLRDAGYEVDTPVREEKAIDWNAMSDDQSCELKRSYIDGHLARIKHSDLVLIANYSKNGVEGYIGANSLMEAAFAYALDVPVAYLKPVGEQPCRLEALSISGIVLGDEVGSVGSIFQ